MTPITDFLVYNTPALLFTLIAGVLAYRKTNGWGWFLFAAIITVHIVHSK